jgi:hypothetical protein
MQNGAFAKPSYKDFTLNGMEWIVEICSLIPTVISVDVAPAENEPKHTAG